MSNKRVYAVAEWTTASQINTEINTLAERHEGFSVDAVSYNGAGGMALFYSYDIEDDSWGEPLYDYEDEQPRFPTGLSPRSRYLSDYSWS